MIDSSNGPQWSATDTPNDKPMAALAGEYVAADEARKEQFISWAQQRAIPLGTITDEAADALALTYVRSDPGRHHFFTAWAYERTCERIALEGQDG